MQSVPQSDAVQKPKREKSPSELGEEVVARVLVEEGIMDPKDLEEYLASFEEPSARTFTTGVGRGDIIGPEAYAARNTAPGDGLSGEAGTAGEDTGPTQDIPEWLALMLTQDPPYLGLTESAIRVGSELKDKIEQLTPDQVNQLALDWLPLLSTPYSDYPELAAFADQTGPWLWDQAKQFGENMHVAPGASLLDKVGNTMDTVLEGAWNGIVDYAQAGVNADLEQQKQQAQQFSFLGGPYQTYADQIADTARSIQETLPEAAEKFRSNKTAEQAQRIEIQKVGRDLQNDRGKALSSKETHDILNNKSDSTTHAQKEWWEKPGASEPIDPNDPAYQAMDATLTDEDRAGGLRVVKIDGGYYIDYTVAINTRLQEVEQDFQNHAIHSQELMQTNTEWFISQVTGYGPWDIKIKDSWEKQFGNVRLPSNMGDTIVYNGQVVTPEKLGNLTYGYLGRAMGWPAGILYLGGGVYNQKELADLA